MAIVITGTPSLSLYPGIIDGRLPAGNWSAIVTGVGDASGNPLTGRCRMFAAADPPNTFCFSLSSVDAHMETDTPGNSRLTVTGFTPNQGSGVNLVRRWRIPIAAAGGVPYAEELTPGFPMMLGYRIDGLDADLEIRLDNNGGAGDTYYFVFQGEWWLQEAGFLLAAQQDPNSYQFEVSRAPEYQGSYVDLRAGRPTGVTPTPIAGPIKAAAPLAMPRIRTTPVAARDPLAPLRAELAAALAAQGLNVATIPGNTEAEVRAKYQQLLGVAQGRELMAGAFATKPPSVKDNRAGGSVNSTGSKPAAGRAVTGQLVGGAFAFSGPNKSTPAARPSRPGTSATRGGTVRSRPQPAITSVAAGGMASVSRVQPFQPTVAIRPGQSLKAPALRGAGGGARF